MVSFDFDQDGTDDFIYSCPGSGEIDYEQFTQTLSGVIHINTP